MALADSEKCISLNPDLVKGYYRKAKVLETIGFYNSAVQAYQAALDIESNHQQINEEMQKALAQINNKEE